MTPEEYGLASRLALEAVKNAAGGSCGIPERELSASSQIFRRESCFSA